MYVETYKWQTDRQVLLQQLLVFDDVATASAMLTCRSALRAPHLPVSNGKVLASTPQPRAADAAFMAVVFAFHVVFRSI